MSIEGGVERRRETKEATQGERATKKGTKRRG